MASSCRHLLLIEPCARPALQILATESYHAGAIRTILAKIQNNKTPYGLLVRDVSARFKTQTLQ